MIDLTGLSTSAAAEVANRALRRVAAAMLLQIARSLTSVGLDRDTINIELEHARVDLEAQRKKQLADIRAWLQRDGKTLQ